MNDFLGFLSFKLGIPKPGKIETIKIHDWILEDKTNENHTSRNIYMYWASIRYFLLQELVGVKNPRYLILFVQVQTKKTRTC